MQQEKSETHRKKARKNGKTAANRAFQRARSKGKKTENAKESKRKKLAWPLRRHVPSTRPTDFCEERSAVTPTKASRKYVTGTI